jgi:hypothetical protein
MSSTMPPMSLFVSADGTQWWDGSEWKPIRRNAARAVPGDAIRSPDGNFWWDGSAWVAIRLVPDQAAVSAHSSEENPTPTVPAARTQGQSEAEKYFARKNRNQRRRSVVRFVGTTTCCGIPCLITLMIVMGAIGLILARII